MDTTTIDGGRAVEEAHDGYLFFTPWQYPLNVLNTGIHKLNYTGETMWKKSIGWDTLNIFTGYFGSTCRIADGYALGTSYSTFNDEQVGMMVRFDDQGDTIFTSTLDVKDESLIGRSIVQIENGFVITGISSPNQSVTSRIFLVKFDLLGNFVWKKTYAANNITISAFCLIQTPDGGFLIGGARIQAFNWDPMLIKTDSEGFEEWREYYGTDYNDYVAMVENTADGNYIFGTDGILNSLNSSRPSLTKVNTIGEEIWTKFYGDVGVAQPVNSVKLLPDGGFIACGASNASSEDVMGFVLRTDADGNEYWFRKYYETEGNYCFLTDIIQDSQGYFVATGDLFPDPGISQDAWALRIDSCGCLVPGCGGDNCLVSVGDIALNLVQVAIGPNPANQFINVYLSGLTHAPHDFSLEVYDLLGKRVHQAKKVFDDTTHMIDVNAWPVGMYIVAVRYKGEIIQSTKVEVVH